MIPFRIKDSLQQRQLKFLKEMIAYYSEDVNRRATNETTGACYYLDKNTGNKCAIGRYIINENSLEFSGNYKKLINSYPNCIPENIKSLGDEFLSHIQHLHDSNFYWDDSGLRDEGVERIKYIKHNIKNKLYDERKTKESI